MVMEYVAVGRVVSAHGIHGKLIIEPMTENPDRFRPGSRLHLEGEGDVPEAEVIIQTADPYKGKLLVSLPEVTDRTGAEALRGRYLYVEADDLPELEQGEYYHHQLVGLRAFDVSGEDLGVIRDVLTLPGQDVIVIERCGIEYMVPFVEEFIKEVDLGAEKVIIKTMPGLFDRV